MFEEDGLHGLEVLARIRDLHPELRVIINGVWYGRDGGRGDEERGQRISLYTVKVPVINAPSWRLAVKQIKPAQKSEYDPSSGWRRMVRNRHGPW
jgi:hypothetical protein